MKIKNESTVLTVHIVIEATCTGIVYGGPGTETKTADS